MGSVLEGRSTVILFSKFTGAASCLSQPPLRSHRAEGFCQVRTAGEHAMTCTRGTTMPRTRGHNHATAGSEERKDSPDLGLESLGM